MRRIIELLEEATREMDGLLSEEIDEQLSDYLDNCKTQVEGATADLIEVKMTNHVPK